MRRRRLDLALRSAVKTSSARRSRIEGSCRFTAIASSVRFTNRKMPYKRRCYARGGVSIRLRDVRRCGRGCIASRRTCASTRSQNVAARVARSRSCTVRRRSRFPKGRAPISLGSSPTRTRSWKASSTPPRARTRDTNNASRCASHSSPRFNIFRRANELRSCCTTWWGGRPPRRRRCWRCRPLRSTVPCSAPAPRLGNTPPRRA